MLGPGSENLESQGETVAVRTVLQSEWQADDLLIELLYRLKHRSILLFQQSCRNVQPKVGINAK